MARVRRLSSEKFEFTRTLLILGNLAILAWVLLASLSLVMISQLYAWLFLAFTAALIFLMLRRLGCSTCYYCKSCTSGFGRLSAWFFGKRELKDLTNKTALSFVAFIYCLLSPIPIGFLTVSLIQEFAVSKIVMLLFLLTFSFYSLATWLKTSKRIPNPIPERSSIP